jgi:hypothetical protein
MLKKTYSGRFDFWVFCDDYNRDLLKNKKNYKLISFYEDDYDSKTIFTNQKLYVFEYSLSGYCVLLDLDIIIQKDLVPYFEQYRFVEPRFVQNYWNNTEYNDIYAKYNNNYLNSSFVTWKDDQLDFILDYYDQYGHIISRKYHDLDQWLFQCLRNKLDFHPPGIVYAYSFGADYLKSDVAAEKYRPEYYICSFHNSHGKGKTLDDTVSTWARNIWIPETISSISIE